MYEGSWLYRDTYLYTATDYIMEKQHVQYKKRLLLKVTIHHLKSDLIYNMDHMRVSGTKP